MDFTPSARRRALPPATSSRSSASASCPSRRTARTGTSTRTSATTCSARLRAEVKRRGPVGAAGAEGAGRAGDVRRRHGRVLRGDERVDLRPGVLQLRGAGRRQHAGAGEGRHAGAAAALARADRRRPACAPSFVMTEPHPGSGSDPSMMLTTAERKGDRWVVHGRKWFITGAEAARHFILVAQDLRRSAQGPDRVPASPRPAGLAHRAPHPDHGTRGARRALRARVRRPRDSRRAPAAERRRRAQGHADPARHRAAHALHALARPRQAQPRDRARLHRRCARRPAGSASRTSTACRACSARPRCRSRSGAC